MIEQPQPPLWQLESIDRLCHEVKNVDPQRMFGNDVFRYIDISSVDNQQKEIVEVQEISGLKAPSRARQQVHSQDILVSTVRPALNAVAIVPDELDGEICSTGFCVLRPKQELIDPNYLFAWVRHPLFVTSLVRLERGIGYPAVSDGDVRHLSIPLPPLPEQRRVVVILRKADELRQLRRQANVRTQQLLPALFDEMFGAPSEWTETEPLSKFVEFVGGGTPSRKIERYFTGNIPWATSKDIKSRYLRDAEEHVTEEAIENSATKLVPFCWW